MWRLNVYFVAYRRRSCTLFTSTCTAATAPQTAQCMKTHPTTTTTGLFPFQRGEGGKEASSSYVTQDTKKNPHTMETNISKKTNDMKLDSKSALQLFCATFEGLAVRANTIEKQQQQPTANPHLTTSLFSSSQECNKISSLPKKATDMFPTMRSLFPDVREVPSLQKPNLGKKQIPSPTPKPVDEVRTQAKANTQQTIVDSAPNTLTSNAAASAQESHNAPFAGHLLNANTRRYGYAYGLWERRNSELLRLHEELRDLVKGTMYLREVQEENLHDGLHTTMRFSLCVVFPFIVLISFLLFNDSTLYTAELQHLCLIDYDSWLKQKHVSTGKH